MVVVLVMGGHHAINMIYNVRMRTTYIKNSSSKDCIIMIKHWVSKNTDRLVFSSSNMHKKRKHPRRSSLVPTITKVKWLGVKVDRTQMFLDAVLHYFKILSISLKSLLPKDAGVWAVCLPKRAERPLLFGIRTKKESATGWMLIGYNCRYTTTVWILTTTYHSLRPVSSRKPQKDKRSAANSRGNKSSFKCSAWR